MSPKAVYPNSLGSNAWRGWPESVQQEPAEPECPDDCAGCDADYHLDIGNDYHEWHRTSEMGDVCEWYYMAYVPKVMPPPDYGDISDLTCEGGYWRFTVKDEDSGSTSLYNREGDDPAEDCPFGTYTKEYGDGPSSVTVYEGPA